MSAAAEARRRYEGMEGVTKLARSELFEQRAKKLAERYGLEIKASDWKSVAAADDDTVLRIDRPIRIRIRRTCHRCDVTFAAAKECPNCEHVRCAKCTRYPPKRTEAERLASHRRREAILKANKENPPIIADYSYADKGVILTRPSKTGGQDLVHKKPRQRVRRNCHECQTLFMAGSKKCEDCGHIRCTDCPRDPYVDPVAMLDIPCHKLTRPSKDPRRTSIRSAIPAMPLVPTAFLATNVDGAKPSSPPTPRTALSARSVAVRSRTTLLELCRAKWNRSRTPMS